MGGQWNYCAGVWCKELEQGRTRAPMTESEDAPPRKGKKL